MRTIEKGNLKRFGKLVFWGLSNVFAFLLAVSIASAAAQDRQVVDRVVAVVNEDIILLSDLEQAVKPYLYKIQEYDYSRQEKEQLYFKLREDVLQQLINEKLTDQQVAKAGIEVSDKEIDEAVERMKQANRLTDEKLRHVLELEGVTMEEMRQKMRENILRSRLVSFEVKSKIVVTEEDIEACYIKEGDKYCEAKKYHLRCILMRTPSGGDKRATEKKMQEIHEKLEQGEDFQELARMYSHPTLAKSGGYLGAFDQETLSSQIRDAVSPLKEGEFTPVLDTDQGFQIFLVDKIEVEQGKTLEEVKPEIEDRLYREIVDQRFESWLKELKEKSHIRIIR